MTNRHNKPLSPDVLDKLEAIQIASGKTPSSFGHQFFGDAQFITRMRTIAKFRPKTHERVSSVFELAAAGQLAARRRVMSTAILSRVLEAVAASGLSEMAFAQKYLGHAWVINRLRKPRLLTAELTARIEAACDAVFGPRSPD